MKKTILFLDADKRYTLSIIRSIGRLDQFKILTAGKSRLDMCRYCKYSEGFYLYPDPIHDTAGFLQTLQSILDEARPDFVFPCSDITMLPIYSSDIFTKYGHCLILPKKDAYFKAFDKKTMNEIAQSLGVKTIEEIDISRISEKTFPLVVKPRRSWYLTAEGTMTRGFRSFVTGFDSLRETLSNFTKFDSNLIIQKVITGHGYGIFVAAKDGEVFASFAHKRIREVPPGGGISTMRKSVPVNSHLLESSKKLIKALHWTGIAMIEFKGSSEEEAYFMEINGRPWGSIDLAVSSGIDFPKIMIDIFINALPIELLSEMYGRQYVLGHYSSWLVGEINYIRHIIVSRQPFKEKFKLASAVLLERTQNTSYDTLRLSDPLPFIMECLEALKILIGKIIHL